MEFIKHLSIKRFKSIKNLELEFKPINILIGCNGAGKSNLLKFFEMISRGDVATLENFCVQHTPNKLLYCGIKHSQDIIANIECVEFGVLDLKLNLQDNKLILGTGKPQIDLEQLKKSVHNVKDKLSELSDEIKVLSYKLLEEDNPYAFRGINKFMLPMSISSALRLNEFMLPMSISSALGLNEFYSFEEWFLRIWILSREKKYDNELLDSWTRYRESLSNFSEKILRVRSVLPKSSSDISFDEKKCHQLCCEIIDQLDVLPKIAKLDHDYYNYFRPYIKKGDISIIHLQDTSIGAKIRTEYEFIKEQNIINKDGANIAVILAKIKKYYPEIYQSIGSAIRRIIPDFASFDLVDYDNMMQKGRCELYWKHNDLPDLEFNAMDLSDGALRYIVLITALMMPEEWAPKLLIIDEPELGLHPKALASIVAHIKKASNYMQIILATQNAKILDFFKEDIRQIITVEKHNRESIFKQFSESEVKKLKDWMEKYEESLSDLWVNNQLGAN